MACSTTLRAFLTSVRAALISSNSLADSDTAAAIKTSLDERVKKQRDSYADYKPDEMYKFDDCFVEADGNTVYYAVCADNSSAKDILG